jgi:hypothetical protein
VHDARWRTAGTTDDFSQWLESYNADPALVADLRKIDFYFMSLRELRRAIQEVFKLHQTMEPLPAKVTP